MKNLFWSRKVGDFVNMRSGKSVDVGFQFKDSREAWWECFYETCLDTVPRDIRDTSIRAGESVWLDAKTFLRIKVSEMFMPEMKQLVLKPVIELDNTLGNLVEVFYKDQFTGTVTILERGQ